MTSPSKPEKAAKSKYTSPRLIRYGDVRVITKTINVAMGNGDATGQNKTG